METLVDIQHWLYRGIGEGLGNVAGGDYRAVMVAMAAAILFGAVHALMPGHGKIVLISYHLGQPSRPRTAFANGAILALTATFDDKTTTLIGGMGKYKGITGTVSYTNVELHDTVGGRPALITNHKATWEIK